LPENEPRMSDFSYTPVLGPLNVSKAAPLEQFKSEIVWTYVEVVGSRDSVVQDQETKATGPGHNFYFFD